MNIVRSASGAMVLLILSHLTGTREAAAEIMYSTTGSFGSTGTASVTYQNGNDSVTITFTGAGETVSGLSDPSAPFGTFTVTGNGGKSNIPNINDTFTLVLDQTQPTPAIHDFSTTITGNLQSGEDHSIVLSFSSTGNPFTVVTNSYSITYTLPNSLSLDASVEPSTFSLTGTVHDPLAVPEPWTMAAFLSGVVPLGLWRLGRACSGRHGARR
jgi:hypothetical protein